MLPVSHIWHHCLVDVVLEVHGVWGRMKHLSYKCNLYGNNCYAYRLCRRNNVSQDVTLSVLVHRTLAG